ncbi:MULTISPECIES: peptidase U32 family protein [Shewanella]|uniref:U32 family peptidase n=1 Tax=Shewanella psychromarinicola TaxID=2487742 RepID=A0A3N4DYE0_9GAMM|nr:peptidase U32 family protein [Shewanella psychromarinicola]AZG35647.1 U32 family peptidase [Shewanella psychromarinicola]MCL1084406.1 U32 family peptidase [Shewanella psychromarinicola]RPA22414.1 U32 family peptidase [Shewanella psychromarinicola]
MNKKIELLAPGGDVEAIKAAIVAGADAVYFGLDNFNARNRAINVSFDELNPLLALAHKHDCQMFLTLNIIIIETEVPALFRLLNRLVNTDIDGVIVQDLGLFYILGHYFPSLDIHASTQVTTHNSGQIEFLHQLGSSRTNLSRELTLEEIRDLTQVSHALNMATEVFVHGSNCISFSGLCYISSVHGGNSGNRGRCSQPCRDAYQPAKAAKEFPLNMKDNSSYHQLTELAEAGVDSLKIEGRIKKPHYVYTVVNTWRKQLQRYYQNQPLVDEKINLHQVFNRDFTDGYLNNNINKDMFIDNPRDNSNDYFIQLTNAKSPVEIDAVKQKIYDDKTDIIQTLDKLTSSMVIDKIPLKFTFITQENGQLDVDVTADDLRFSVRVDTHKQPASHSIDQATLTKRFSSLNNDKYRIEQLDFERFTDGTYLSYKLITELKRQIEHKLNGDKPLIEDVQVPSIVLGSNASSKEDRAAKLVVLIANDKDIELGEIADICYYLIPEKIGKHFNRLVKLFNDNQNLAPWFPSILIGDDFSQAVALLNAVQPKHIVANNTGIGFAAFNANIDWIAGPQLNLSNSFSLEALKRTFNCSGAFISNELARKQIRSIKCPEAFELHYSIYHPTLLMTSRQCFFHQVTGCKKDRVDNQCLPKCAKHASIINVKDNAFVIDKQKGSHNSLYNNHNFMNLDIVGDLAGKFTSLLVDLRDIKTSTQINGSKADFIEALRKLIAGDQAAIERLTEQVQPTISNQYTKGI